MVARASPERIVRRRADIFVLAPPRSAAAAASATSTVSRTSTTPAAETETEPRHHRVVLLVLARRVDDLRRLLAAPREDGGDVARALAAPETRRVVIRRARENMAEWVVRKRPDVRIVRLRERRARWGDGLVECAVLVGSGEVPVEDGAF